MARNPLVAFLLRTAHPDGGVADAELLRRYADGRDEAAFELLVRRHADAVWRVCRGVSRQAADAEDAFQATFLALARKPGSVRGATAAGWLHRVAVRVATKARAKAPRGLPLPDNVPAPAGVAAPDVAAVHEELARLPDRYRLPVVLCDLEGQTHAEAAAQLGWPVGTVSGRLSRARDQLRDRLVRRGVGLPAGGVAALLAGADAGAVSRALMVVTAGFGSGAGVPGPAVTRLATGVLFAMRAAQMKALFVPVAAVAVAVGGVAWSVGQTPQPAPKPAATDPTKPVADATPAPKPPTAFGKLMTRLVEVKPKFGDDEWAVVIRDMIRLGPDATPELVAGLDAANDNYTIRCLAFVARGIGDKRAVPALIRSFPKTCGPDGSDCGFIAKDPELLAFMQKHDTDKGDGGTHYNFGRAINEVRRTLQQLTGVKHTEDELNYSSPGVSPRQLYLVRSQFHRCAGRWAAWWEAHWNEVVSDERYARVYLPALAGDPAIPSVEFPHGPGVKFGGGLNGATLQSVQNLKAKRVFFDLDTGREAALSDQLRAPAGQPERFDDIAAWAAVEGFDLMGTEYSVPGNDAPRYALRGLGLAAWRRYDGDHQEAVKADIRRANPLATATRVDGLLLRFDEEQGRYDISDKATYLFRTREKGYGVLFVGVEVHDTRVRVGMPASGEKALDPVGFYKGRRFSYTLVADGDAPAQ